MSDPHTVERTVVVTNPAGLHVRPCAAIVGAAKRFRAKLQIVYRKRTVDAGNILELMTLGAPRGASLLLRAEGPDAEAALDAVTTELAKCYD